MDKHETVLTVSDFKPKNRKSRAMKYVTCGFTFLFKALISMQPMWEIRLAGQSSMKGLCSSTEAENDLS